MKIIKDNSQKIKNKIEKKAQSIANYYWHGKHKIKCCCGLKFVVDIEDLKIHTNDYVVTTNCTCGEVYDISPIYPLTFFWINNRVRVMARVNQILGEFLKCDTF